MTAPSEVRNFAESLGATVDAFVARLCMTHDLRLSSGDTDFRAHFSASLVDMIAQRVDLSSRR